MTIDSLAKEAKSLKRGIRVEVSDGEVRVDGKTYSVRDKLKGLGFQWASETKEWYYLDPLGKKALEYNHPLPTAFANGIDLYLVSRLAYYEKIAGELNTSVRIAALLKNLGILFASGQIDVKPELTEAIKHFVDVVAAKEANLEGYGFETVYKLKSEFEKYFGDKLDEDTPRPSVAFTKNQLLAEENKSEGYALPSPFFWEMWNSPKKKELQKWLSDCEYELRSDGYLLGLDTKSIIYLPYEQTKHIKELLDEL